MLHLEYLSYLVTPWVLPYMDASLHEKRMAFIKDLNQKNYKEEEEKHFVFINKPENLKKKNFFPKRDF